VARVVRGMLAATFIALVVLVYAARAGAAVVAVAG
jgi:hypothetical protein